MKKGTELLYLTKQEVIDLGITMAETLELLETCFKEKGYGNVEMPAKIGIHTKHSGLLHAMPAWFKNMDMAGIKWVGNYYENSKYGIPAITGLQILNDCETGVPYAVMDCAWLTSIRTGGVSGVTAKYLANPDSEVVGVIGCGVQGRTNLEAIATAMPGIKKAYAYDIYPESAEAYAKEMSKKLDIEVIKVSTPKEAVVEADILATSGPTILEKDIGVIEKGWLKKGCTVTAIDFDHQFKRGVIKEEAGLITTDDINQYTNFLSFPGVIKDLPNNPVLMQDIVIGKHPGRESRDEIIFTCNIGLALEDLIVADAIYKRAVEKGVGTILPL